MALLSEGVKEEKAEDVERLTEHGYNVVFYNDVPYPPFVKPKVIDELRQHAWLREDDIVVATYPKCGTTWMQNIVMCLLAGGDASKVRDPMKRSKWPELVCSKGLISVEEWMGWQQPADEQVITPTRRVIKTHAPTHLCPWAGSGAPEGIPKGGKVIVVTRNPKDTAVSLFHHSRDVPSFDYSGEWPHFLLQLFLPGKVEFGDFWSWHSGWHRAQQAAPQEILWIPYEEMKKDLPTHVARIAEFCNIQATAEVLAATVAASSFEAMKRDAEEEDAKKIAMGKETDVKKNHIRAGVAGGWRKQFSEEENAKFDLHHVARSQQESLPPELFDF